ncbi:hypothetical protein [Aeromicrobium sp. P5_D10]
MFKRLVVATSVSALAILGSVSGASAEESTASGTTVVKVAKYKAPKPPKVIDWDAPTPAPGGGVTTMRIDWD